MSTNNRRKPGPTAGSIGAERISAAHRGGHEHDKRGGFAADPERARTAGQKGGTTVRARYGPEFFVTIGRKGGKAVAATHGREHFSRIGSIGGSVTRAPKKAEAGKP